MNPSNTQAPPVALVTGGARRIGAAITKHLHQEGFQVVIHCHHSICEAQELVSMLNHIRPQSAMALSADLGVPSNISSIITQTLAFGKRLNLLVNNASLFTRTNIQEHHAMDWDAMFNINVKAPYLLSEAAYPALAKTTGSIINITDIHANTPLKNYSIYCQSKAALLMQTKSLAREYAPRVRVNAIAPGAIAWPEGENALNDSLQQHIINKTPLKRHGEPIYIAQALLALANNTFITGQVLAVDGGRSLV